MAFVRWIICNAIAMFARRCRKRFFLLSIKKWWLIYNFREYMATYSNEPLIPLLPTNPTKFCRPFFWVGVLWVAWFFGITDVIWDIKVFLVYVKHLQVLWRSTDSFCRHRCWGNWGANSQSYWSCRKGFILTRKVSCDSL